MAIVLSLFFCTLSTLKTYKHLLSALFKIIQLNLKDVYKIKNKPIF